MRTTNPGLTPIADTEPGWGSRRETTAMRTISWG